MKKPNKKLNKTQTLDGERLWKHVTDQTVPLDGRETLYVDTRDAELDSTPVLKSSCIRRTKIILKVKRVIETSQKPQPLILTHFDQPGMEKRSQQRMRQGKLIIDARTDLHGMTRVQAHRVLVEFIDWAWQAEKRMVLVITGKGIKPDGTTGVLRTAVPRWLNENPNRERILGFSHAAPKDGGEGALYVRLKRSSKKRI